MKKEIKKRVLHRLRIIKGQVKGLEKMVEDEKYCVDIITQSQAIKEALSSVSDLMLENHLSTHVIDQIKTNEKDKAVKEILYIYKLSRKK